MNAFLDLHQPLAWLAGCVALAVVATNAAWQIAHQAAQSRRAGANLSALAWLMVSLFWLLPPLIAWRVGALSLSFMGIAEIDWVQSLASGAPLMTVVTGLILFGWLVYRRTAPRQTGAAGWPTDRIGRTGRALLDAALLGWHWAFYRAAAIGWLAGQPDAAAGQSLLALYWGSWLGLACVGLEWVLNPFARAGLRVPGRQEAALRRIALALAVTAIFVLSRNLWLCLAGQILIEIAIAGWFPVPARANNPEE